MELSPAAYNLPARTTLVQVSENHIAIVVDRKSRIIMADGKKLLDKTIKIKEAAPNLYVSIVTTAPVCSKTKKYFQKNGIALTEVHDTSHFKTAKN